MSRNPLIINNPENRRWLKLDQDFLIFFEATFEICLTVRLTRSILGGNFGPSEPDTACTDFMMPPFKGGFAWSPLLFRNSGQLSAARCFALARMAMTPLARFRMQ